MEKYDEPGKMEIQAYLDDKFEREKQDAKMLLLFKQNSLNFEQKVQFGGTGEEGKSKSTQTFKKVETQNMNFEFIFDRTGAIPGYEYSEDGVKKEVDKFKSIVSYDGDIHRPPYIKLTWNQHVFKGNITEVSINYTLMGSKGIPLRAIVKVKLGESTNQELNDKEANESSPDLTHSRIVKEGDTLPLMTHRIYGDSKYYLEVARANKLNNFRKLDVGSTIYFPPIAK